MSDDRPTNERLASIEAQLSELSIRAGRQVAVTEALRSDIRMLTGLTNGILTALQALVGSYTDLASRVTDLEGDLR